VGRKGGEDVVRRGGEKVRFKVNLIIPHNIVDIMVVIYPAPYGFCYQCGIYAPELPAMGRSPFSDFPFSV